MSSGHRSELALPAVRAKSGPDHLLARLLESVHGAITLLFSELYSPWVTQVANIILITF